MRSVEQQNRSQRGLIRPLRRGVFLGMPLVSLRGPLGSVNGQGPALFPPCVLPEGPPMDPNGGSFKLVLPVGVVGSRTSSDMTQ